MLIIVLSLVLVVVLTVTFGSPRQSVQSTSQEVMEEGSASMPSQAAYHYGDPHRHYHDSYYNRNNPVFSPDRRYVWDGNGWVSNERGFGGGLLIGLIVGVVAALYLFSQY